MQRRVGRAAVALFFTVGFWSGAPHGRAFAQPDQALRTAPASEVVVDDGAAASRSTEAPVKLAAPAPTEPASGKGDQVAPPADVNPPELPSGTLDDHVRAWLESRQVACDYRAVWSGASQVLVACGVDGYMVLGRSANGLVFQEVRQVGGAVIGFFQHDGKVWARVLEERAVVVNPGIASTIPPPAAAEQPPFAEPVPTARTPVTGAVDEFTEWPTGDVLEVDGLRVKVSVGTGDGVEPRMRVAFSGSEDVVGLVTQVEGDHSWVALGMNERVRVGDPAVVTAAPVTASRASPDRMIGVWELRAMLRPILNLGEFGGGVLGELGAGYRSRYFHYGAQVTPFGIASADDQTVGTLAAFVFGAFDSKLFSAGIGLGGQTVNLPEPGTDRGSGITLVQLLRIGAVDGLHVASRTRAVVFRSQTDFSSLELSGQLAISRDAWLILRGGGGNEGYGYGEIAVRSLLDGNGGAGSLFLEVSVGGAAINEEFVEDNSTIPGIAQEGDIVRVDETVGGPIVGVGLEWRL